MRMREPIEFLQEATTIKIPDGTPLVVPEGTMGYITQILGGSFTVQLEYGYLVRLEGQDAAVIGQDVPEEAEGPQGSEFDEDEVWAQLRTCYDPEIPVNIVDLGLIYGLSIDDVSGGKLIQITMTLTAPGCGMGQVIKDDVEGKLRTVPGVVAVNVELTFDPPWGPDRMSEEAQLELGFF